MPDPWSLVFQSIVSSVPVILSGAIGAAIALVGVFVSDRNHTKRQALQLQHEADQKQKDRLAALRRDVYLQAPREAVKALAYLGSLSGRDLSKVSQDEGITGYGAVAAQIGVLSDISTASAVSRFGNALALEFTTALVTLSEVQDLRSDIDIAQGRLDFVFGEIQRMQAEQQRISEIGNDDPRRASGLQYWIDVRRSESTELIAELDQLRAKFSQALATYNQRFFERLNGLSRMSIQVMREVRKEIGLAHDLDEFERELEELASDLRRSVLEMMQTIAAERSLRA